MNLAAQLCSELMWRNLRKAKNLSKNFQMHSRTNTSNMYQKNDYHSTMQLQKETWRWFIKQMKKYWIELCTGSSHLPLPCQLHFLQRTWSHQSTWLWHIQWSLHQWYTAYMMLKKSISHSRQKYSKCTFSRMEPRWYCKLVMDYFTKLIFLTTTRMNLQKRKMGLLSL